MLFANYRLTFTISGAPPGGRSASGKLLLGAQTRTEVFVHLHRSGQGSEPQKIVGPGVETRNYTRMIGWVAQSGSLQQDGTTLVPTPNALPTEFKSGMVVEATYLKSNRTSRMEVYDRGEEMYSGGLAAHEAMLGVPIVGYLLVQD